ncbi:putative 5xTM membrane YitT family protein [Hasllibacter halocynthiae]|uniref:Putative 5xTM membrane YitT family protein n=1 Tax=Hasllibacter halocynthiae TaxID=595589 RepID=A0A2T0X8L9_9RHOB|nr:YitT family protein [Hasllibacter halocynthiae]PRY95255.1 putative 5xTM membrane YitT family protein [Hasllibacter halocynthiae]
MSEPARHTPIENAQGLVCGTMLVGLAVSLLLHLGLVTGQVAGVAALTSYVTGWSYGAVFFALNLPFYVFGWAKMGARFTLISLACVATVSLLTEWLPAVIPFGAVDPWAGSVWFGVMAGFGFIAIFRHGASMGGVGIVALWLQDATGFRAGWTQLIVDAGVFAAAFAILDPMLVLVSLPGTIILNLIIALNHRRDRYVAR